MSGNMEAIGERDQSYSKGAKTSFNGMGSRKTGEEGTEPMSTERIFFV